MDNNIADTRCAECETPLAGKPTFRVTVGCVARSGPGKVGVEYTQVLVCTACAGYHHQPVRVTP